MLNWFRTGPHKITDNFFPVLNRITTLQAGFRIIALIEHCWNHSFSQHHFSPHQSEEEQRSGSLPRLPSIAANAAAPVGPVKSARYRAPGFRTATRAASAPGLHVPRRRRVPVTTSHQPAPAAPASAPSLQGKSF